MKQKLWKRLAAGALAICLFTAVPGNAIARTLGEVEAEQNKLEEEKKALEEKLEGLRNNEEEKRAYQEALQQKIDVVQTQIDSARKDIDELNLHITELTLKLEKSQQEMQDTIDRFSAKPPVETEEKPSKARLAVIYEDHDILVLNKPAGMLSQKAGREDFSVVEAVTEHLLLNGSLTREELLTFRPGVCNRLDRNTSGIVLCAKSLPGAQLLGELLKDRTLHKYYQLYVKGLVTEEQLIEGYLQKDEKHNKVVIVSEGTTDVYIKTKYRPLRTERDKTLLEVELLTGRSHQIKAHLASIGHPLLGDYKYGDRAWNDLYQKKYQVRSQLLHAYKVVFPELSAPFEAVSGKTFYADIPKIFETVSKK